MGEALAEGDAGADAPAVGVALSRRSALASEAAGAGATIGSADEGRTSGPLELGAATAAEGAADATAADAVAGTRAPAEGRAAAVLVAVDFASALSSSVGAGALAGGSQKIAK